MKNGQQTHGKNVFNLNSQQKNANRNYYLSYLSQKAAIKEPNTGEDVGCPIHSWRGCKLDTEPLWKSAWSFQKKTKIRAFYELALPFLGFYTKDSKAACHRDRVYGRTMHSG